MTTVQNLHVATGIIAKYSPEGAVIAEHDVLYVYGPVPDDMSPADAAELQSFGWVFDPSMPAWRKPT